MPLTNIVKRVKTDRDLCKYGIGTRIVRELARNRYLYIMALPVILYYIIFHYGPMYGALIAFKKFDIALGIWRSPWVGFEYFIQFFSSYYFWRLLRNTVLLSTLLLLFAFPAPILFALLLNEIKSRKFKRSVQTITYLPHFISIVVLCGLIVDFVSRDGIITNVLSALGMERNNLLNVPEYFRTIYVISNIWQNVGWSTIIYLAALSGIDDQLYEAAIIDGAGRFRQLIHITIPGIMPTIIILLILRVGQIMNIGFEKVILLYNPSIYSTADVISTFVYRKGLSESFEFSYTTAVGLFNSTVSYLMLVFANWFSRKVNDTSLW